MQVKPGHSFKSVARKARNTWILLQQVEHCVQRKVAAGASKHPNPVVYAYLYRGPQRCSSWLTQQAEALLAAEEVLYTPSHTQEQYRDAFERLGDLHAAAGHAARAANSWPTEQQGRQTVLHLHPCWAGHVPWSLALPGCAFKSAEEAAEALLVSVLLQDVTSYDVLGRLCQACGSICVTKPSSVHLCIEHSTRRCDDQLPLSKQRQGAHITDSRHLS